MGMTGKELLENYKKKRQGNNVSSEETTETTGTQLTGSQLLDNYNRIKTGIETENVMKSEDFEAKSGYVSTESDNWWKKLWSSYGLGYDDLTYEYINNQNGLRDEIKSKYKTYSSDNIFAESESDFEQKGYDFINEQEVSLYNYYYNTEGKDKAQEYLDSLENTLVQRKAGKEYEALEGETLKELFYGVVSGADQWRQGVENFGDYIVGGDGFTPSTQYVSSMVRDDLADNGFKILGSSVGQIGYDLINTTTNMLPSILVGAVTGGLGGAATLGVSAVGNAYSEMRSLGYDEGQSRTYATLVGAAETGLQYILGGISKLGGKLSGKAVSNLVSKFDNAIAKAAITLGGSMASEGLEEGIQTILEPAFKAIATGEDFESPKWEEVFYSAMLGALSAGTLEGMSTIPSTVSNIKSDIQAKEIYGDSVQDLLVEAVDIGGEAANVADKYLAKYEKKGKLSGANLNAIVNANEQELRTQDKAKIKSAVEAKLTEYGETGDVSAIADILVKRASGEQLTSKEVNILNKSKAGHQVSGELNEQNLRSGALANDWAADIGTERINADVYNRDLYNLATQKVTEEGNVPTEAERVIEPKFKVSEDGKTTIDGNEASIKEIASIKDGDITLRLENGEAVNANDVEFSPSDEMLYATVVDMNLNAETANAFIRGFNATEGLSVEQYALGFREAYRYGSYGFPVQEMSRDGFSASLSESQKSLAYGLGKVNAKYETEVKQNAVKNAKVTNEFHKDSMSIEEAETVAGLTDRQKTSIKAMKSLSKSLGLKVRFFESAVDAKGRRVGENGRYDPSTGIIYIDLHAGLNGEGTILFTAAHELTHHIRKWSPDKFKIFADFLLENYGKKGVSVDALVREQIEKAKRKGRDISYDTAYEEVIADSCEAMLADGDAIATIAKLKAKDKSLWKKIKDFITDLVTKIKEAYKGLKPDSPEGRFVGEMIDVAEQLKALWTEALVDASENYNAAEKTLVESGIAVNSDTNSASLLSVRDVLSDDQRKKVASALATRFGVTKEEAMDWLKAETSMASLILNPKYSQYLDYTPDPNEVAIKQNSDYPQGTVDFSPICAKRREFTSVMNNILRLFPNHVFAATDLAKIRTIMQEEGMTIPCGICYVEDRRQLDTIVAQNFIDSLKLYREGSKTRPDGKAFNANQLKGLSLIDGDSYTPSVYELVSLEGLNVLKEKNPNMAEAWVKFNNARGMQSVRLLANEAEYKRQILKYTKKTVQAKNDKGGLRVYSFSDAEMFHLIDIIQVITDSATVGLSLQGYTKVNEYARAVKDTGEKLNRSLIPKGELGYHIEDGKVVLDYDTVEGIDINHPDFFDNRDNPNVGNITIGVSDVQIRAAMVSDFVDQIIPFHTGQSEEVLGEKGIATWTNYKDFQTEKDIATGKVSDHQINIYTEVLQVLEKEGKPINKRTFVEKFLQVCKDNGLTPRFSQFLNTNENGEYVYTEGYHKMLVDFKTFAQTEVGEYLPQMPVKPIFDNEYITKILKDYVKSQKVKDAELSKSMPKVIERITNEIVQPSEVKYSDRVLMGSLFSGGGTLEAGLVYQMLDKEFAVEYNKKIASVYTDNHGKEHMFVGDVRDFNSKEKQNVFYLHASPVCKNFSPASHSGGETTLDITTAQATARVLEEQMPQVFTVENVKRYIDSEAYNIITSKLDELGYTWDVAVYKASDYGNATKRERMIIRAVRDGQLPTKPQKVSNITSWGEATKDLWKTDLIPSNLVKSKIEAIKNTPELKNLRLTKLDKPLMIYDTTKSKKVTFAWADELAPTLTTKCGDARIIMPDGRVYAPTPKFMGRIQGLPDDYKYPKAVTNAFKIIGNGIPTQLTKAVMGGVLDSAYEQTHDGQILYSDRDSYAPTFYSHMGKVIDGIKAEKIGANDVVSYLKGKGVKDEEIKWSGIETFLEGKKSVTKAELQEFVAGSQIQIEEEMGEGGASITLERSRYGDDSWDVMRGGEILDTYSWNEDSQLYESDETGGGFSTKDRVLEYFKEKYGSGNTRWEQYKLGGGTNYRELVFKMPNSSYTNKAMQVHWGTDAEGVLAHARMQDMTTSDGKKMLFVEEIQSDWHNEGQKSGYKKPGVEEKSVVARRMEKHADEFHNSRIADVVRERISAVGYEGAGIDMILTFLLDSQDSLNSTLATLNKKGATFTESEVAELSKYAQEYDELYRKWQEAPGDFTPPDAPFKDTYHEYVLKRLLRMAAEEGYDSIGWTTADVQMGRWNPQRQTNLEMGIRGTKNPNAVAFEDGYRIEYDQDIPKFLRKYGKKWGANVGKTMLDQGWSHGTSIESLKQDLAYWQNALSTHPGSAEFIQSQIKHSEEELRAAQTTGETVWSMDIPDSMKESVLHEGQVLYSDRVTDEETLDFLNKQLRNGEVTKVYRAMQAQPVDENGNVIRATVMRVVSQSPLMVEAKTFGKNGKVAIYPAKLFSPMAGMVNGKWSKSIDLNEWEETTFDLAHATTKIDEKTGKPKIDNDKKNASYGEIAYFYGLVKGGIDNTGKKLTDIPARYNPYIHTSLSALNDQFSSANKRPELVTVECIVPNSELTSGFRAEGAKDRVGAMSWHSGPTSSRLAKVGKARTVILTRYDMPIRVVPDSEVAKAVAEYIGDTENIAIQGSTVTPSLSRELMNLGISVLNEEQWSQYNKDFPVDAFGETKYSDRDTIENIGMSNGVTFEGKPFWIAMVNRRTGKIEKAWTYEEAESEGFDLNIYEDVMEEDGYVFFTTDLLQDNGRIEYDDYGDRLPDDLIEKINKQIKVPTVKESLEGQIRKLHDKIGNLNKSIANVTQWIDGSKDWLEQRANNEITYEEYESHLRNSSSYYRELDDERTYLKKEMDGLISKLEKAEGKPWKFLKSDVLYSKKDISYSDRDTDSVSNRSLLANALESVAQNDIEKTKLTQYKEKIALIESEQKKLEETRAKIKELSFAKGARDTEAIKKLQFEANQMANRINTYDKQLLNLESTKALKGVLEREKSMLRKRLEQKGKESLAAYREKATKTQRELLTRYQEARKNAVEGRNKTAMRHKIKNVVSDLNKLLLNPTKEQHVPIGLQGVVADALDAINMDTMNAEERVKYYNDLIAKSNNPDDIKMLTKKRDFFEYRDMNFKDRITALKNAYAEFKESDDPLIRNAHNDAIADLIKNTADAVGNKSLKDMSLGQLEMVYDMYKAVLATVRNSNKMFKEGRQETVTENSESVKVQVKEAGGHQERVLKATKFLKKFGWDMLKPVTAMKVIGSKTLAKLFDNVRAAEDTWAVDVREAKAFYEGISKKYGYNKWDFKAQYSFKDSRGEEFTISLEQMLSLYAYSKREQADEHLEFGGFIFDDAIEVTEKNKLGIPVKYEVNDANPHRLGQIQMMEIIGKLTQDQKAFVDEMQTYLSDVMGAKGNEVSLALYDIKLYKEKNYFPLKTARYFREFDPEKSGTPKIKNSGFSKKTVPQAGNPIVLSNFMDVWASHVNDMSMYHAFVLPLEDFMRVYNYSSTAGGYDSVQQYIKNAYGSQANQYIERLMDDLNGGARVDSSAGVINKGISLFKKASVFASASVVVQQPSAIARAFAYINPKYFATSAGSALNLKKHKEVWAEVKKYAPVAVIKEMGYFDTGMGRSTVEWIKGNKTIKDKMDDALSKAPAMADELSWSYIWLAVKKEIAATTNLKPGSEEFLNKVGERFTEIITNTQVYDSVLSRSGMMRSKDTGMKMATAFMAEPTTTVNMMVDGIIQGKRGNKKFTASTVGAISASIILNSILVALVYAARDDDEDETYTEKYVGSLTTELVDGFNPLTYIPFVKDIWSIAQGYDVERSDMSVVSNLWESIEGLFNENKSGWEKVSDATGAVSSLFGIPLKNVIRDAKGMFNLTKTLTSGTYTTGAGIADSVEDALTSSIPLWDRLHESDTNSDRLYEAIMSGDQTQIDRIKGRFADEKAIESAMRTALREHDSRIKEAAQARYEGDISEYTRIAKEIIREGNFSQDIVVGAINAEMNAIKRGETTEEVATEDKDEVTSIYSGSDINSAFDNGDFTLAQEIISDLIETKVANGMEEKNAKSSLRSSMTSYWKPLYKEAYQSGDTNEMARIRQILYSSGLYGTANEVVKTTQSWLRD